MITIAQPVIGEEEKQAVMAVLDSGQLAQGPKVQEFEEEFAAWSGTKYAVAVSSGTAALHLALLAHEIGRGDHVITSSFSFMASASTVALTGAQPHFADIEPEYFTIDPEQIIRQYTPHVRAIIPVHLFGQACDMEAISEIAERYGLIIIEDACQAHGAKINGRKVGSFGTACYSFYPTKNMTTGEGGMITTNDATIADRLRLLRNHGMRQRYLHEMVGYNLRMMDLQAAIGLVQLRKLEQWNHQRQANAAYLTKALQGVPFVTVPSIRPGAEHVFHQYTVRVPNRNEVARELQQRGIGTGIYYPLPIHRQQPFADHAYYSYLPITEASAADVLSLPVHPSLTTQDLDTIVQTLCAVLETNAVHSSLA
jgi:dTDP-4-amino-4,6-dideoxygalactose transaminase